jgi:S-formylglutathione hydrolase FrmB
MAHLTCHFFSDALGLSTSMQVLLPQSTGKGQIGMEGAPRRSTYPVLYLLHGWSDDDTIWMRRTAIERHAAAYGLIVVMPRVDLSYYQNMSSGMRYWDFISEEVPTLCREWFPVSTRREDTFAAGLSMGGYGAFRLGLACPGRYAAVASLSGALDLRRVLEDRLQEPDRSAKMRAIFGPPASPVPPDADLLELATSLPDRCSEPTRFYQWCGTEDFLYEDNVTFRDHAGKAELDLTYREGPGDHSWPHWDREIQPVLEWMLGKPE